MGIDLEEIRYQFDWLVGQLYELDYAVDLSNHRVKDGRVTWNSGVKPFAVGQEASLSDYLASCEQRAFSAQFRDGALLQLSCAGKGGSLVKYRYCYFPSPVLWEWGTSELTLREILEDAILGDYESLLARGPLRFDLDVDAASDTHPLSHLTTVASSCRVPVLKALSAGHFVRFVLKHFYEATPAELLLLPCQQIREAHDTEIGGDEIFLDWRTGRA